MKMVQRVHGRLRGDDAIATWHEVDSGFWVGNAGGVFLGSIERFARGRYLARDAVNQTIGEYAGLGFAQTAVVARTVTE